MRLSLLFARLAFIGGTCLSFFIWHDWKHYWNAPLQSDKTLSISSNMPAALYDSPSIKEVFPGSIYLQARLALSGKRFHAGQYCLRDIDTRAELYRKLVSKQSDYSKFHIRGGWTWKQLSHALDKNTQLKNDLKSQQQRGAFLAKIDAVSLEGIFAPQTYFFIPGMTQSDLLMLAYKTQKKILAQNPSNSPFLRSDNEILTLASIIEKEGNSLESFRMVSGVFHNRLAINMRLQSDATVLYLMDKRVTKLSRQDLLTEGAHNTYQHNGLPPYAIAYPSKNAIIAAVDPIPSEYLYFLTDAQGRFMYSKEFKQHVSNKKYM